jgi:hypothetical protein
MGLSTYVVAIRPPDERWEKMKAVYDACIKANIPLPEEVENFFDGSAPDPVGVPIHLDTGSCGVRDWHSDVNDTADGVEVVLAELPPDVKILRFVNSY